MGFERFFHVTRRRKDLNNPLTTLRDIYSREAELPADSNLCSHKRS